MLRSLSDHLTNICVKSKGVTISTEKLTNRHKTTMDMQKKTKINKIKCEVKLKSNG